MANVNFNAVFSAFVNWYFNVNNANQINANFLRECGFDEMQFDENYIGAKGIKNANQFAKVIKSHYNETANFQILPDKMTEFAKVTFSDGVTWQRIAALFVIIAVLTLRRRKYLTAFYMRLQYSTNTPIITYFSPHLTI